MTEDPYAIAFEAGKDALSRQHASLDGLRTRAAGLLSGASIATAFLGAQALKKPKQRPDFYLVDWEWPATISFVLLALLVIAILWPRKDWVYSMGPKVIIGGYIENRDKTYSVPEIRRNLALHLENHFESNRGKLNSMYWLFRLSCALLAVQVVAWILDLTTGG